ncbi:MAG TPA: YtxH domain-containing protein [Parafilimonas sp.]
MNAAQKFLGGIMLGVAAGVAIALFINSDKGKKIISDVTDAAGDATDNLKNRFSEFEKQAKDLLQKGKTFVDDIEGKVKDFTG